MKSIYRSREIWDRFELGNRVLGTGVNVIVPISKKVGKSSRENHKISVLNIMGTTLCPLSVARERCVSESSYFPTLLGLD